MPTLYHRSISIQLSVANLAKSTTQNPQARQCRASTDSIKHIDLEFAKASGDGTLAETAISGDDGRHLRYLGEHEDMPLLMVRAGKDFFHPTATEKTTMRPAKSVRTQISGSINLYDSGVDEIEEAAVLSRATNGYRPEKPPTEPHALCLTVFLSKSAFSQMVYKNRVKTHAKHDIKIDVYFNGQFFDSQIMAYGQLQHAGSRGMKVRMHRFTGYRHGRFIEKPWIFVPPHRQPDGDPRPPSPVRAFLTKQQEAHVGASQRTSSTSDASILDKSGANARTSGASHPKNGLIGEGSGAGFGANGRWTTIASRLLKEVNRTGRDRYGERSVTAKYLESLAALPAPRELQNMQHAGGGAFGVIDVVVIWGQGQKDAPNSKYLIEPTRLRPKGYPAESMHAAPLTTPTLRPTIVAKTRADSPKTALLLDGSGNEPSGFVNPALKQLFPPPKSRSRTIPTSTPARLSSTTPSTPEPSTRRTTPKRSRETSISSDRSNPSKKPRIPYFHVITAKQTCAEEVESIVEQAVEDTKKLITRRTSQNLKFGIGTADSSPLRSNPEKVSLSSGMPKPSKIVALKVSPHKLANSPLKTTLSASDGFSDPNQRGSSPPGLVDPGERPLESFMPHGQGLSAVPSLAANTPKSEVESHSLDAGFVPPKLSEECCVTFAERGVVRSVGAVRGGWFQDKGVLMGTRFIVG